MFELSKTETDFLKALDANNVRFMIVGLTSAVLQNAHVVTQDIDLWIESPGSESFNKAVESVGGFYVPPGTVGMNPPMLGPASLKIFDIVIHMHGLESFDEEYKKSKTTDLAGLKIHLLPLERIIISKKTANREKDRAAIPALEAALAVSNEK